MTKYLIKTRLIRKSSFHLIAIRSLKSLGIYRPGWYKSSNNNRHKPNILRRNLQHTKERGLRRMFLVCRYQVTIGSKKTQKNQLARRKIKMNWRRRIRTSRLLGVCWGSVRLNNRCRMTKRDSIKSVKTRKIRETTCQR